MLFPVTPTCLPILRCKTRVFCDSVLRKVSGERMVALSPEDCMQCARGLSKARADRSLLDAAHVAHLHEAPVLVVVDPRVTDLGAGGEPNAVLGGYVLDQALEPHDVVRLADDLRVYRDGVAGVLDALVA